MEWGGLWHGERVCPAYDGSSLSTLVLCVPRSPDFKRSPRFGCFYKRAWHLVGKAQPGCPGHVEKWRRQGAGHHLPHGLTPLPKDQEARGQQVPGWWRLEKPQTDALARPFKDSGTFSSAACVVGCFHSIRGKASLCVSLAGVPRSPPMAMPQVGAVAGGTEESPEQMLGAEGDLPCWEGWAFLG